MRAGRAVAVGVVLLAAVVAGGWWWAVATGQARLRAAVGELRAAIGPGGSFAYDGSRVHPLSGSAELARVTMRLPSGELVSADRATVWPGAAQGKLVRLQASGLSMSGGAENGVVTAATLDASDVVVPPTGPGQPIDPATVLIGRARLGGVVMRGGGETATADAVSLAEYGAGRPTAVEVRGLAVPVPNGREIDRVTLADGREAGIDLAAAVNALRRGGRAPAATRPVLAEIDGFAATAGGAPVVSVTRAAVVGTPAAKGGASTARMTVDRFSVRPTDARSAAGLRLMGLGALAGSVTADGTYDAGGGRLTARDTLALDGLGRLGLALDLEHLDVSAFAGAKPEAADVIGVLNETELVSATVRLADQGFVRRAVGMAAASSGADPVAVRAGLAARIGQEPALAQLPDGARIGEALAEFVQHGGVLTVLLRPAQPVALLPLLQSAEADPAGFAAQLGLRVTAGGAAPAPM